MLPEIIRHRRVEADLWRVLDASESVAALPEGPVAVTLAAWIARREELFAGRDPVGVWLSPEDDPGKLGPDIELLDLIAVHFPKFADGRGYSIAYNLRARLNYQGEIRAIGDVLRDQLFYMQRVGFNAFATRPDRSIEDALKGLTDFSEAYQASWDQKAPLFRRVHRTPEPATK